MRKKELTSKERLEIYSLYKNRSHSVEELARLYNVAKMTISQIVRFTSVDIARGGTLNSIAENDNFKSLLYAISEYSNSMINIIKTSDMNESDKEKLLSHADIISALSINNKSLASKISNESPNMKSIIDIDIEYTRNKK